MRNRHRTHLALRPCTLALVLVAAILAGLALTASGCRGRRQPAPSQSPGGGAAAPAGGSATPATGIQGAKPPENLACKLLTPGDAEDLLGGPVQEPPVTSSMADIGVVSWRCGYISQAKNPTKVVTLLAKRWQQADDARRAYEHAHALSQTISGQVPETMDGLGDRAYWSGGKVNQLNVLRGTDWLVVSGTLGSGLDQLGPAKAAAVKILARY